jgi:hypothetical protein
VLLSKYPVLGLYLCAQKVLNEGCSFSKSSLWNKENSRPTTTHTGEAESVRSQGSSPKLLLIGIKSFPKILLSDYGMLRNRRIFTVKGLKEIRREGVERFIWLMIGTNGGPL